jgi:hypothetical protein
MNRLYALPIPEGQAGTAWEPSKSEICFLNPPPQCSVSHYHPSLLLQLQLDNSWGCELLLRPGTVREPRGWGKSAVGGYEKGTQCLGV